MVRRVSSLACAVIVIAAGIALVPPTASPAGNGSQLTLTTLESGVIDQLNVVRVAHGLAPLTLSRGLSEAALAHCSQMVVDGYFSHDSMGGGSFPDRIGHFYPSGGWRYWSVGENLLWTTRTLSPSAAVTAWMRSAEHRQNLLEPDWRQIGLAAITVPSAPGVYDNLSVTVITADFGVRR